MGIFEQLTGSAGAKAAKKAAAERAAAIQKGMGEVSGARDQVRGLFDSSVQSSDAGRARLNSMFGLDGGDGTTFEGTPGFQFALDQGLQARDRAAAAGGFTGGGRAQKEAIRFGTGIAQQDRGDEIARLLGFTAQNDQGLSQLAGQEQSLANYLAQLQTGVGEANAGGIIGANNAKAGGLNNIMNLTALLAGNAAKAYSGGA